MDIGVQGAIFFLHNSLVLADFINLKFNLNLHYRSDEAQEVISNYWLRSSLLEKQGTCKFLGSQMPLNPLHALPFSNTGSSSFSLLSLSGAMAADFEPRTEFERKIVALVHGDKITEVHRSDGSRLLEMNKEDSRLAVLLHVSNNTFLAFCQTSCSNTDSGNYMEVDKP
ncbi:hypothetical protein RJT34_19391 [Clitoria ternatea]|uniref:Uncharacterized protein n=1 Tax=Clitoria ternatea TaxID=43366 RepID=A0AAN9IR85_CLITE